MKLKSSLTTTFLLSSLALSAQVQLNVDVSQTGAKVSPDLYGIFYEDINNAADGGIYAELVRNRSFEDNANKPDYWEPYGKAIIRLEKNPKQQLNKVQHNALEVTFPGKGISGVSNAGFWGIPVVQGRTYKLSFWAKGSLSGNITAFLSCKCGKKVLAIADIPEKITGKWKRYTAQFTANANDTAARLFLASEGKGKIDIDVVSLFPPTYKNRDNGLRPDLVNMLIDLHPKFMRFPGGCFVEGQNSPDNAFRWERTVGPIERRPGHENVNWGYRTTDGLGFHEYLQLAEDLGAKPLYVVNIGLWHGGMTPVDSIQPWVDEAMNALEYANGPTTSKYGEMRALNGHPAPFNIEYIEIGNENNQPNPKQQSDHYYDRFRIFRDAILAKYPKMHIIGDVVAWGTDDPKWKSDEKVELLDEHYYRNPRWFADNFHKYDSYERGKAAIYVGEYAVTQGFGNMGNLNAALGEAVFMMGMENNSDVVRMASYAPLFANLNRRVWAPDMIQFDGSRVFGTPSYYVQKLMFGNIGTRVLKVEQENPYEHKADAEPVSPKEAQFGVATYNTHASFKVDGDATPVTGEWKSDGDIVSQTSDKAGAMEVMKQKYETSDAVFKVRARKNSGKEGFIIVFNYVDDKNYSWVNLGGWGNTQHGIEQTVDGGRVRLTNVRGNIETGKWYDVELRQHGDSVTVLLDGKQVLKSKLKPINTPGIFSTATLDEKTGDVIVKVVNTGREGTTAKINLKDTYIIEATVCRLSGAKGTDENTLDNPLNISPRQERLSPEDGKVSLDIPAYSLNIVRIKK